ncbi:MAG: GNAT family N-acetyltransferase [Aristaeellaceae bacterium]
MNITLRIAVEADLPAVLALSNDLLAEDICNGLVADTLDSLRPYRILLAEQDGAIVGYAYGEAAVSSGSVGSCRKGERFYSLEMLYVKPDVRSKGVGRMLFQAQVEYARSLGLATLRLTAVGKDWQRQLRFYQAMGMEFLWATMDMVL